MYDSAGYSSKSIGRSRKRSTSLVQYAAPTLRLASLKSYAALCSMGLASPLPRRRKQPGRC